MGYLDISRTYSILIPADKSCIQAGLKQAAMVRDPFKKNWPINMTLYANRLINA